MFLLKKFLLFCVVYFVALGTISALEPTFSYIPNVYSNRVGENLYSGQLAYMYLDSKLVYCLDPYLLAGSNYSIDENYLSTITADDLDYFELVAFYGYNKTNRNSLYYYMATQEIIWEKKIGPNKVFWSTQKNGLGNILNIESYKNEIKGDVENFSAKPSFDGEYIEHPFFTTLQLWDMNSVINDYDIIFNGKSIINKENNYLSINFLDSTTKKVILLKKPNIINSITGKYTTAYSTNNSQTLVSFGQDHIHESVFYIGTTNSYNSKVGISFYEKDTNKLIEDFEFKITKRNDNSYSYSSFQNNSGLYLSNSYLDSGLYNIVSTTNKYILNTNMNFEINEEISFSEYNDFKFYVERVKGKLVIIDDEKSNYKLYALDDIKNENVIIYNKDDLVFETNEKSINDLPIGRYYLVKNDDLNNLYNVTFEYKKDYMNEIVYELIIPQKEKELESVDYEIDSNEVESIDYEIERDEEYFKGILPNTSNYYFIITSCLVIIQLLGVGCVKYKN